MKIFGYDFPDLLIKVSGKQEYIEDLCGGKVFMNESGYFRKLDDNYRGDRLDGKAPINLTLTGTPELVFFDLKNPENRVEIPADAIRSFTTGFSGDDKIPLFCCSQLDETILRKVTDTEWAFCEEFISEMEKFGEYYLIFFKNELLNGLVPYADGLGAGYGEGKVSYQDISQAYDINRISDGTKNLFQPFLKKDISYKWQNEWRVFFARKDGTPIIGNDEHHHIATIPPLSFYKMGSIAELRELTIEVKIKEK